MLQEQREWTTEFMYNFNVDFPTPSTILVISDHTTKTPNNVPQVTLLISKYHLISVIYYYFHRY